jgi:hypothetical protein
MRRFPIVPAVVGVAVAALVGAVLPAQRVPLSLIGLFAGEHVERIDVEGGLAVQIEVDTDDPAIAAAAIDVAARRVEHDGLGVAVERMGDRRALLGIPRLRDRDADFVERQLAMSGTLEFKIVHEDSELMRAVARDYVGPASVEREDWRHDETGRLFSDVYLQHDDRAVLEAEIARLVPEPGHELRLEQSWRGTGWRSYYLYSAVELGGAAVESAEVVFNPTTNRAEVLLTFDDAGAERFADLTEQHVGHKLAIVLDGAISSAPVIQSRIPGGRSTITMGAGDPREIERDAEGLVGVLRAGAMPAPVRVLGIVAISPLVSRTSVWLARIALALFAGAVLFGAAYVVQRLLAAASPVAEAVAVRGAGASPRRPWLRLAVTIAGPALVLLGSQVLLPTLDRAVLGDMFSDAGGSTDTTALGVLALGLAPILAGFVLVELAALALPRWRRLRHDPAGRPWLALAGVVVGLLVAVWQAYMASLWLEGIGRGSPGFVAGYLVAEPGFGFRAVTMLTLTAGSAALVVLAAIVGRYGLGNGFSILLATALVPESRELWRALRGSEPTPLALFALVGAAGAVVLATVWAVRARVRGARLPATGLVPIAWGSSLMLLMTSLFWLGVDVPFEWLQVLQPASMSGLAVLALLVVALGVACAWLFCRTGPAHPATLASIGYLLLLVGAHFAALRFSSGVWFDLLTVAVGAAIVVDVVAEWRARVRHGELALVRHEHRVQAVDALVKTLHDAGVPAHTRGAAHRSLLHFFGPFVPISIYVPADRAADARRVLAPET